jgi:hypothetical protein
MVEDSGPSKEDAHEWKETVWNRVIEDIISGNRVVSLRELIWVGLGDHPIDAAVVDQALQTKNWELGDDWNQETAGIALQFVQQDWMKRSGDLLGRVYKDSPNGLDLLAVTNTRIYIADRHSEWERRPIGGIIASNKQDCLRYIHKLQAAADGVVEEDVIENEDIDIIILNKPKMWKNGEAAARKEIIYLIHNGLTPPEAIDYWLVERLGVSQSLWAEYWRERGQGTISGNVTKGKKKLRENRPELLNPEDVEIPESKIFP